MTALPCRIAFCACYARNTWSGQNFPFLSQALFYENGTLYDQLSILNEDFRLDPAKLAVQVIFFHAVVDLAVELSQGLPWFASSQVLTKIGNNLAIGATVMHVFLWYGKDIIEVIKKYKVANPSIPCL